MMIMENNQISILPISEGKCCDYCKCGDCQTNFEDWEPTFGGDKPPLECADGAHICNVCFHIEGCNHSGKECEKFPRCEHKPVLANYSYFGE